MIYDTLDQASAYYGLNNLYEKAFGFLSTLTPQSEDRRYEIDGDSCYAIVYTGELRPSDEAELEVHDKYIDIQTVITGFEGFGIAPRSSCTEPIGDIDTQKDILFFRDSHTNHIELTPGEFAIFAPNDAHAPLIGSGRVKKAVVKVALQD